MRNIKNNRLSRLAAVLMSVFITLQTMVPDNVYAGNSDTINIYTAEELLELSKNCSLDTWSQGKTVELKADISLRNIDFSPIPTFGGNFQGNGHTISDLSIIDSYSPVGLFGILQENASVNDLKVTGNIAPSGEKNNVGGIAGINNGNITNCTFTGFIEGGEAVGGITGNNSFSGTVSHCRVNGQITGENMTGGIAGQNSGFVSLCTNDGFVNTSSQDSSINLDKLNDSFLFNFSQITSAGSVSAVNDTGGIAGYSTGTLMNCTNNGTVGYPHFGYNTGGIVGRSCGHMAYNVNNGEVYGRKDVGGILGQMEPDITLNISEELTENLRNELNKLKVLVSDAIFTADSSGDTILDRLETINGCIGEAADNVNILAGQISDIGDQTVSEINRASEIVSNVMANMADISRQIRDISANTTEGFDKLETTVHQIAAAAELGADMADELKLSADEIREASGKMNDAFGEISDGKSKLSAAVAADDEAAAREALEKISDGLNCLSQAHTDMGTALEKIVQIIKEIDITENEGHDGSIEIPDIIGNMGESDISENIEIPDISAMISDETTDALNELALAFLDAASAEKAIAEGIRDYTLNLSFNLENIPDGLEQIDAGLLQMVDAYENIDGALMHISNSLLYLEGTSDQLAVAFNSMADTIDYFEGINGNVTRMLESVQDMFDYLKSVEPIQAAAPGEDVRNTADSLYTSVKDIESQLSFLNSDIRGSSDELKAQIEKINDQFDVVGDTVINMFHDMKDEVSDGIITDASEEQINAITDGKVFECENYGAVYADINVGGVAGCVAIEYGADPEDDISLNIDNLYREEFELKAVLQNCKNEGTVTSKRDCVGSVTGKMDFGLITGCEGYGSAESESGDYVGGIAGICGGSIQDSFAKCLLSGRDYIGGVVGSGVEENLTGSGSKVSGCYTLINIEEGRQYLGGIAGSDVGHFSENYFVSLNGLAAINRLSYSGKAEPVTYEELMETPGLPNQFEHFSLKFIAEDEVVLSVEFEYGDTYENTEFPEIPEKEDCFGKWDQDNLVDLRFDTVVRAVYSKYITALESADKRPDERPVFFVQGEFSDTDSLKTCALTRTPESFTIINGFTDVLSAIKGGNPFIREVVEQWNVEIPDDGSSVHNLRYLCPDGEMDNLSIYVKGDNGWIRLDTEAYGSYLEFTVDGNGVELAVLRMIPGVYLYIFVILVLAVIIVLVIIIIIKIRKNRIKKKLYKKQTNIQE